MKKHAAQFYDFELVLCWFHRLYKKYIADIADLGKANTQLEGDIACIDRYSRGSFCNAPEVLRI